MTEAHFEFALRDHQAMVYSIAYSFFRNAAIAEEVAQDDFMQLYENRHTVQSQAHLVSWLRKTTVHRCIDAVRRRSLSSEIPLEELPEPAGQVSVADPLLEARLQRLVASLPENQRTVVILRFGEDMTVDEIAGMLDMPARTVWSHLQRAIAMLREKSSQLLKERSHERIR
jgi:RNA polymerase sigma-70 factor (ECF subfamily)